MHCTLLCKEGTESGEKWVRFSLGKMCWQIRTCHAETLFMVSGADNCSARFFLWVETSVLSAQVLGPNILLSSNTGEVEAALPTAQVKWPRRWRAPQEGRTRACSLFYLKDSHLHVLPPFKEKCSVTPSDRGAEIIWTLEQAHAEIVHTGDWAGEGSLGVWSVLLDCFFTLCPLCL